MKWLLSAIVIFAIIPVSVAAQSLPLCDDFIPLRVNCTFVTPTITCNTFDYDVFYKNGTPVLSSAPLSPFNGSIYQFNFTLTDETENYVIQLCDGTTREVTVQAGGREGNGMTIAGITLLLMGSIGILTWVSFNLTNAVTSRGETDGKWTPLRVFFLVIAMIFNIGAINLARILSADAALPEGVTSTLEIFYVVGIVGLMGIGFIAFVYYIVSIIQYFQRQRIGSDSGRFDR